jgi:hypothetical protein
VDASFGYHRDRLWPRHSPGWDRTVIVRIGSPECKQATRSEAEGRQRAEGPEALLVELTSLATVAEVGNDDEQPSTPRLDPHEVVRKIREYADTHGGSEIRDINTGEVIGILRAKDDPFGQSPEDLKAILRMAADGYNKLSQVFRDCYHVGIDIPAEVDYAGDVLADWVQWLYEMVEDLSNLKQV